MSRPILLPPVPPVTLTTGQVVPWPAAPLGWAQVIELRRTRVVLFYRCRSGLVRRPVVHTADLERIAEQYQLPLPLFNPFERAAMGQSRAFRRVIGQRSEVRGQRSEVRGR